MSFSPVASLVCGLALLPIFAAAQYGYSPQGPVPAAGQGLMPAPMDPNMGMTPGSYVDGSAYSQPGYVAQPNYISQPTYAPMGAMPAAAGGMLTYGMLEVEYNYTDFEDEAVDPASGIGLTIMAELFNPFFIQGTFNWGTGSGAGSGKKDMDYSFRTISIGGGAHLNITERFHLVGEVGGLYSSLDADRESLSFSDGAVYIHPHLRVAATDKLEFKAGLFITSADDYDARIIDISGYYQLFSKMDIGLGADIGDQSNNYHLGVRFRW